MSNEVTVKIKCELEKFYEILKEKNFKYIRDFSIDDTYFIPENLKTENMTSREILSKAILVRDIDERIKQKNIITFKKKDFDNEGNILNQEVTDCEVKNIEQAKKLLQAIGYKEIMRIKENDKVYKKDDFEFSIKDIENGDKLIEIEEHNKYDTIEKIIKKINEIEIPIYTDSYFVKKAEVQLNKILKK